MRIYRSARHPMFDGDLLFFHARRRPADAPDWRGWAPYVRGRIERIDIDCGHLGMCQPASLSEICRTLGGRLRDRSV